MNCDHITKCNDCNMTICSYCCEDCSGCGKELCKIHYKKHQARCSICDRSLCKTEMVNNKCQFCDLNLNE